MPDTSIAPDRRRFIVRAFEALTRDRQIAIQYHARDWVLRLSKNDKQHLVYGYDFDLNPTASRMIVHDKACFSDMLAAAGIPHVPHRLFLQPDMQDFVPSRGNWADAMQFAKMYDYNLVCKINQGTGGLHVYRIRNQRELEAAFQEVHHVYRGLSLSPYVAITREYRLIMLDGRVLLAYEKVRPTVTGDGAATYQELLAAAFQAGVIGPGVLAAAIASPACTLDHVPATDETVPVLWKHNLGKGAGLRLLDAAAVNAVRDLAHRAFDLSGLRVGAVDVILCDDGALILEINAGIMLENFARHAAGGEDRARAVYAEILDAMFG